MNRQEAEATCERLAREDPEHESFRWFPRQSDDGEWSVIRLQPPEHLRRDPTKATVESKPKPRDADEPHPYGAMGTPWVG